MHPVTQAHPDGRPTLWLVRHGESTWNARGLVQGQTSAPALTGRGRAQARSAAAALAGQPVVALYTSDLRRAVETAGPVAVALGLPFVEDARLRERGFGVAEGTLSADLGPEWSGIADGRVVDADAAPPGGESVHQLCRRVAAFVEELRTVERAGDVVLVVHGGVVRAVEALLDGVDPVDMSWTTVDNGSIVRRLLPRSLGAITGPHDGPILEPVAAPAAEGAS